MATTAIDDLSSTISQLSTLTEDPLVPNEITVPLMTTTSQVNAFRIKRDVLSSTDMLTFTMTFILIGITTLIIAVTSRDSFYTYFLSSRGLSFIPLTCSMIMSSVGTAHFVGMAGLASQTGIAVYAYELNGVLAIIFMGWVFLPVYIASGSMTTVDYLKKRYGSIRIEIYVAVVSLLLIVTTKVSVELYAIFKLLQTLFEQASPASVCVPLLLMALMVPTSGGLRAVVYTNTMQMILFAIGAFFLAFFCISSFPYNELKEKYFEAWPNTTKLHFGDNDTYKYTTCGIPRTTSWHLLRPYNNIDLPWPGMLFGINIVNFWYWCCDQLVVQTGLGAKNIVQCKYACLVTAYVKILSVMFLVLPGLVSRIVHTDLVACADPDICEGLCGSRAGCSDQALPLIFLDVIPANYRGFVLAAVVASCITSLASSLHSGGSVFTVNIYRNVRSRATEVELIVACKAIMLVLAVLGLACFRVVALAPSLYNYTYMLIGILAPPIVAVYLCGIFWDRAKEENAFVVLMGGLAVGLIRLVWEMSNEIVPCGDEEDSTMPDIIQYFHFLHFAIFLFVLCMSYMVFTGVFTEPILMVHLYRIIYWLRFSKLDRVDLAELQAAYKSYLTGNPSDDVEVEVEKEEIEPSSNVKCPRPLGYVCCMSGDSFSKIVSNSELRESTKYQVSIREGSANSKALNIHATLLLVVSAVMWGYFS